MYREDEDEVVVVTNIPGVERENITVSLIKPTVLIISSERPSETLEAVECVKVVRQEARAFGPMKRVVPLPKAATAEGSKASFMNGML